MADLLSPGVLDSPGDLVALALAGDEAAFARIVRLHREAMVRVAYVVTGAGRRLSEGNGRPVAGRGATGALAAPEAGR